MKIGILGGGGVGQTLATGLKAKGHDVVIGIRAVTDEALTKPRQQVVPLADWQKATDGRVVTLAEAAAHGEVVINATQGQSSLEALAAAGAANLKGKILIDVANPLDFSAGMPPFIARDYAGPTSLGEQIQAAYPDTYVVKAFNTIAAAIMVNPGLVPGAHDFILAGNSADAKAKVADIARGFGWQHFLDLGDIVGARASEAHLALWVRLWTTTGTPMLNIHVAKA